MTAFTIYPAIDLRNGRCVRLLQGRAEAETVYGEDPVAMARHWQDEGAKVLHVVDLDGAFEGRPAQVELIGRMAAAVDLPVQVGGGLRTDEDVKSLLDAGVSRAILGTRAWQDPDSLARLVERFGDAIAVGIDARDGKVQIKGWTETTDVTAVDLAKKAAALGVATLIVTDTATDGMLTGVNAAAMAAVCDVVRCNVIASGGVASVQDVETLVALGRDNLAGAIVGKALYEKRATLAELNTAAQGDSAK